MKSFQKHFERFIVLGLLAMMSFVVFLTTIELAVILIQERKELGSGLAMQHR